MSHNRPIHAALVRSRKNPIVRAINRALLVMHIDLPRLLSALSLQGIPKSRLILEGRNLMPRLTPILATQNLLRDCLKRGDQVMIASASFDFIVEAAASHFGITQFRSTLLEYDSSECCSGRIQKDLLGSKHKHLPEWIDAPFILVTDNRSDVELVALAQHTLIISQRKNIAFWKTIPKTTIIDVMD